MHYTGSMMQHLDENTDSTIPISIKHKNGTIKYYLMNYEINKNGNYIETFYEKEKKHKNKNDIQILCYLRDDTEKLILMTEQNVYTKTSVFQDSFIRRIFHKMRCVYG
jgi:deoxyadenosine/deoxycytidine kinase